MILFGKPMAHQSRVFEKFKDAPQVALLWSPGVGKTYSTIQFIRYKFNQEKRFLRTIILSPPIVMGSWRDEITKFSSIDPKKVIILSGSGVQRLKLFQKHAFDAEGKPTGCIFITNYQSLLMGDLFSALLSWAPEVFVGDELHRCKNPSAKQTKFAVKLSAVAKYRYGLTGTMVLNTALDVFSQFLILDGGATFGANWFVFRARWFYDKNVNLPKSSYFPDWRVRPGSLDEMSRLMAPKTDVVKKEDALDLPPLVRKTIKVAMAPEQRRMYLEMKKDLIAFLGSDTVVATMALTKSLRMLQLCSGYAKTVDGKELALADNPKVSALTEILTDVAQESKVIVWAVWKSDYAQIRGVCNKLGLKYIELHGEVPEAKRQSNMDAFRNDPEVRVTIGHPGACGIGITLTESNYTVRYSRNFSLEAELQSIARNHRKGSEVHERVTLVELVCEDSIDELVMEALQNKEEVSFKMLQNMQGRL